MTGRDLKYLVISIACSINICNNLHRMLPIIMLKDGISLTEVVDRSVNFLNYCLLVFSDGTEVIP